MVRAACWPDWIATCATPGSESRLIRSPTTKISGCPGTLVSGATTTRPARSVSAPVRAATRRPNELASTPAAHKIVSAAMRLVDPSGVMTVRPVPSRSVTRVRKRTSTPFERSRSWVSVDSAGWNDGRTRSAASSRMTRLVEGAMLRNSPRRVRLASSAICPAISTPVGPAPTTTNVSALATCAAVPASSARSKAVKIRPRSSRASSTVFMPGANSAKWSLPKYDCPAPAATTRLS